MTQLPLKGKHSFGALQKLSLSMKEGYQSRSETDWSNSVTRSPCSFVRKPICE